MSLTTRQNDIYKKIKQFDPSWTEENFAKCWNDILKLNKFVSIKKGKLILEFDDPNHATIKFEKDRKVLLNEKIYWNEYIKVEENKNEEVKQLAQSIKTLADRIILD
jgi:HAMP domain-containing protein